MRQYSLKLLLLLFVLFAIASWFIAFKINKKEAPTDNPAISESGKKLPESEQKSLQPDKYPLHSNINATIFWVGEEATSDNKFIHNKSSEWIQDWVKTFGGVDTPKSRNGWLPAGFTPKENPFYVALPYGDYTDDNKLKDSVKKIHWYDGPIPKGGSILKNQWVKINRLGKSVYAQLEDVGPFEEDDVDYVFGTNPPKNQIGIDLSPATAEYLGIDGQGIVSWEFVDPTTIPEGPWAEIVTQSGPDYR